jgi:hypothetical protein
MRSKLLNWLEKLAKNTFQFTMETLFCAIEILDQYLRLTNESSNQLQLIGSTCLYIASKICERTIVAAECYATASCNIFEKTDLFEKERKIFALINLQKCNFNMVKMLKFLNRKHYLSQ